MQSKSADLEEGSREHSFQMVPAFFMKQGERLTIEADSGVWDWGSLKGQAIKPET